MIDFIRAQVVLTRAGMPDIQHPLVFFPHRRLGIKAVRPGVKVSVASFYIHHKTDIAEVTRFRRGVKPQEGDATFVDGLRIFEVGSGDVQRMVHLHNIDDGTTGLFRQLAKLAIQLAHLQAVAAFNNCL